MARKIDKISDELTTHVVNLRMLEMFTDFEEDKVKVRAVIAFLRDMVMKRAEAAGRRSMARELRRHRQTVA